MFAFAMNVVHIHCCCTFVITMLFRVSADCRLLIINKFLICCFHGAPFFAMRTSVIVTKYNNP